MIRRLVNIFGAKIKGKTYEVDEKLIGVDLIEFIFRRFSYFVRGVVVVRKFSRILFVGPGVIIRHKRMISFGRGVTLGHGVMIDGLSKNGVSIGDNVNIGPHTIIQASGVITRLGTGCSIGKNSGIGGFSFIGAGGGVEIGSNVIMGQYISFHSENHNFDRIDIPIKDQGVTRKGIIIGDDCWVGAKVTFIDGCEVGSGCVIAAGSVVRGKVPSNSVIGGVPAKIIKNRG